MKSVEIYITNSCGYCRMAKSLLTRKGVKFHVIDVSNDPDMRMGMTERAGGRRTVPQIFIGEIHIGGYDDLHDLEARGALDPMLGR
ncbi:MAG: glutaredoxin 3 [Paracoccaceae bacterium]|jgi:glutaredoxin 3